MSSQGQGPGLGCRGGFQISQGCVDDILETFYPFGPELGGAVAQRILSLTSAVEGREPSTKESSLTPNQEIPPRKGFFPAA